ncbi:MAG: hypothetical protein CVU42_13385 [Chloroflexi bacterium HGW-Chloroflexi-4]|jgi:hypothetical protein|nr:MAG: hypothetical protein CVU42_13385 [Chloroflexi bacterium HGW-Chloroflexi-4]
MPLLVNLLVTFGSSVSIGFGVWHFFVLRAWKWYSYMDPAATELAVAIRAINVFFSLSLVLFGLMNILFIFGGRANRFAVIVLLTATCILWMTRLVFQIIYPQGSINPALQFGMLAAFAVVTLCYLVSLGLILFQKVTILSSF